MSIFKLALIIKNSSNEDEILVVKQVRPPKFGVEEYDSHVDSDLWDLPSAFLNPLEVESLSDIEVVGAELGLEKVNLRKFDIRFSLNQVSEQLGLLRLGDGQWTFWKHVEEPEFGPGRPMQTVFIVGRFTFNDGFKEGACQWVTKKHCLGRLLEVKQGSERMGPLLVVGLLNDTAQSTKWDVPKNLNYQEYPPGFMILPMRSKTAKPFHTTNLVVVAPENAPNNCSSETFAASGDAIIVDPGCNSVFHGELAHITAALPRKLIVFVTHHHRDHVDGLSIIQKCNPDAILLAHENTMRRIGRGDWSLSYISISGGEEICVGGQKLSVLFAPGHTDGHLGLLHISTHTLIVGDHCVGQGSAVLDATSGGNMADYFETTQKFLELSPHVLVPMHGRVNLWPKQMLCGYLKNRRNRESAILKAIENGANTLFDLVAMVYSDVDRSSWWAASMNVKLHVEHLALQDKLPEGFSLETFKSSFGTFADTMTRSLGISLRINDSVRLEGFSLQRFKCSCWSHFAIKFLWVYLRSGIASMVAKD
ncbi:hypothetical protein Nepgr_029334 [Nepenthes gracilis]|uniref:Metallo-beta-lactamase domain-containing protein n=1 Tax=Nepenthes gracilis TaxID=150966 RepID=A0AAD3TDZ5_NEPGR|nr:hypothetical protein Nepgr_029334 [Nepenthes gracilis]